MKKKILIWVMVIIFILGGLSVACYVYRDTIKGWFSNDTTLNYTTQLKALQDQLNANNNEISVAQQEINANQAIINESQADTNAETVQKIADLEAKNKALQDRIATLETENQKLQARIDEMRNGAEWHTISLKDVNQKISAGECSWFQVNNVVFVNISDLRFVETCNNGDEVLFSGLPRAVKSVWGCEYGFDVNNSCLRWLVSGKDFVSHYSTVAVYAGGKGNEYCFSFSYLTDEVQND